jgi:hypothetical protein
MPLLVIYKIMKTIFVLIIRLTHETGPAILTVHFFTF